MNTCNTCKYWNVNFNNMNNVSDCDIIKCNPHPDTTFEVKATANDDSGLDYTLFTSANFGCILHSPKK